MSGKVGKRRVWFSEADRATKLKDRFPQKPQPNDNPDYYSGKNPNIMGRADRVRSDDLMAAFEKHVVD